MVGGGIRVRAGDAIGPLHVLVAFVRDCFVEIGLSHALRRWNIIICIAAAWIVKGVSIVDIGLVVRLCVRGLCLPSWQGELRIDDLPFLAGTRVGLPVPN